MKRFIALLLCAVMALTAVSAIADSRTVSPSKTIKDLYAIDMRVEGLDKNPASLVSLYHDDAASKECVSTLNDEVESYKAAEDTESYFTESEFSKVRMPFLNKLSLDDVVAVFIDEYEMKDGKADFVLTVPNIYEKDSHVVIALKCMDENAAQWILLDGIGLEDGAIAFAIDDAEFLARVISSYMILEIFSIEK